MGVNALTELSEHFNHFFFVILCQVISEDVSVFLVGRLLDSNVNLSTDRI